MKTANATPPGTRTKINLVAGRFACWLCMIAVAWMLSACATSKMVSQSEGKGTKRTFKTSYQTAWMASRGALTYNNFRVLDLSRQNGTILAKRDVNLTSFGQSAGLWIHTMGPELVTIEVYTHNIWGPGLPFNNEKPILNTIATLLDQ